MAELVLADLAFIRGFSIRHLSSFAKENDITTNLIFAITPRPTRECPEKRARLSESQKENILRFLKESHVKYFGCSLMTGHFRAFRDLASYLRTHGFTGHIIAGGVHATILPEETLTHDVDYVVRGPGEKPLVDMIQGKPLGEISGLVYRRNGQMIKNEIDPAGYLHLDNLPFPDYDHNDHFLVGDSGVRTVDHSLFKKLMPWAGTFYYLMTSRGCPYRCAYCCNVNGSHMIRASVDRVMDELHSARRKLPYLLGVNVQDDSFFMGSDEWLREFCHRLKQEFGWPFIARIIPRFATPERLKLLKEGGLEYAIIGLQGSERLNREVYNRRETNGSFVTACLRMAELDIFYVVDIILDVVYETEDDLRGIARTLNQLPRPFKVQTFSMTPFPGTRFYDRVIKDGLLDRFAADAYESMFHPARSGAYRTPLYWHRLIQDIIPIYNNSVVDSLIEAGPHDESAARTVYKLYRRSVCKMRVASKMRMKAPRMLLSARRLYKYFRIYPKFTTNDKLIKSWG